MNEKDKQDKLKARLEMLFAAALLEITDEPRAAKTSGTAVSASNPSLASPPQGSHVGAISQYSPIAMSPPAFHGTVA